jgi:hypothetical protein
MFDHVRQIHFINYVVDSMYFWISRLHSTFENESAGIPCSCGACMIGASVATSRVFRFGILVRVHNPSPRIRQERIGIGDYYAKHWSHVAKGIASRVSGHILIQHRNNVTVLFGVASGDMARSEKFNLLRRTDETRRFVRLGR